MFSFMKIKVKDTEISKNIKFMTHNPVSPFHFQNRIRGITNLTPFCGNLFCENQKNLKANEQIALLVHSTMTAIKNPERADAISTISEITGYISLQSIYKKMVQDSTGRRILHDKPLVSKINIDIENLYTNKQSFGHAYATYMKGNGFDPDSRDPIKYLPRHHTDLRYIMLRYRQCHDYWHALTGLSSSALDELALKWIELIQIGLPIGAISVSIGKYRLEEKERQMLHKVYIPWAIQVGKSAKYLMNIYYEELFDMDIHVLREKLGIKVAPQVY